jgi:hypothetical protein
MSDDIMIKKSEKSDCPSYPTFHYPSSSGMEMKNGTNGGNGHDNKMD